MLGAGRGTRSACGEGTARRRGDRSATRASCAAGEAASHSRTRKPGSAAGLGGAPSLREALGGERLYVRGAGSAIMSSSPGSSDGVHAEAMACKRVGANAALAPGHLSCSNAAALLMEFQLIRNLGRCEGEGYE